MSSKERFGASRSFERAVLVYSPLWMLAVGVVGATGMLARWGDGVHLAFGCLLALPIAHAHR